MIHVDRTRVPPPPSLQSQQAKAAAAKLEEFFSVPIEQRRQLAPPFAPGVYGSAEVRSALLALFHHKCAYCETVIDASVPMQVDQFRPKSHAVNADGSVSPDGYWWLAYEWTNLFPTCRNCNHLKGSRFPIQGTRAVPGTREEALAAESPLLLNPCTDRPEQHFVFSEDGRVASDTERGRVSINVLGLNRDSLVAIRQASIARLRSEFDRLSKRAKAGAAVLEKLAGDATAFAGARRQFLSAWIAPPPQAVPPPLPGQPAPPPIAEDFLKVITDFDVAQRAQESYSIVDEGTKADYFVRTRVIDRIEIHNFRPIDDLTLRFPEPDRERTVAGATAVEAAPLTPWLMLLGENGSGKSSVLQAVALTLIGDEWRRRLKLDASRYVRRGETEGYVRVYLVGAKEPIELSFSAASPDFSSEPKEPKVLLLGYGSTRLLPRRGMAPPGSYEFARIDNLLDPFVPLNDAAAWLASVDEDTFETVARALRSILQLKGDDTLTRGPDGVEAVIYGTHVSLDELSDGYQSVVALATDIMRVMLHRWKAMEVAEGIVVLDEIGSHLHPRWRMRIVSALRETFPRVQFLASTHEPLCLRGLMTGEVVVMTRDSAARVAALTELPSIAGLRVDQLLTSEYFGMSSTIDPELEEIFIEYYRLLALRRPSGEEKGRIAQLRSELDRHRVLGANQRERMMLEAIDQYIAVEKANPAPESPRRRAATTKKLMQIWAQTPAASRPPGGSRT